MTHGLRSALARARPATRPGSSALRCDIAATSNPQPRRPLGDGRAFETPERGGSPVGICHGETAIDGGLPALAYGSVRTRGDFSCRSEASGVTCTDADGRGFARAVRRLF